MESVMKRVAFSLGALLLTAVVFQGQQPVVRMRTLNVRDILYVLTSDNSNSMALMRDDGVVLIDSGLPGWDGAMRDTIGGVSDQKVATIVNTNADAGRAAANAG